MRPERSHKRLPRSRVSHIPQLLQQQHPASHSNISIKSGHYIRTRDEPSQIITPWHFIRSLHEFHNRPNNQIPPGGLTSMQIHDIIKNIYCLFNFLFMDYRVSSLIGVGHSPFSRFSPLAGHLLLLSDCFQQRHLVAAWTDLPSDKRQQYMEYVFLAISELFQLYETWLLPKFDAAQTFLPVQIGKHNRLICLSPVIDIQGTIKSPALSHWRSAIEFFTADQLQYNPPNTTLHVMGSSQQLHHPASNHRRATTARPPISTQQATLPWWLSQQ
jgi:hypothetical protein